jgi:hypothetical protein
VSKSSQHVARAVRLAKRLMPADGDLMGLLANLAEHRGREIHMLTRQFTGRPTSGLWLAGERADYIVIDHPTTPSRRAAIICHEVAHILLGHEAQAGSPAAIASTAPDLSPALVARAMGRHSYAEEAEADAEQTATLIGAEHRYRQINASRLR